MGIYTTGEAVGAVQGRGNGVAMMATDTTALAVAIRAMRAAVLITEIARVGATDRGITTAMIWEEDAGRALLAALEGVPERLAALEVVVAHRKVRRAMSALEGEEGTLDLEDALAVLAGEGPG